MSRIHEALKKAERERSAIPAEERTMVSATEAMAHVQDIAAEPAEFKTHFATPRNVAAESVPAGTSVATLASDFLRFDDIRKRCPRPEWHFDPNVNVFANPALSEHGAEQFRTLRSRLYQVRTTQPLRTLLVTSSVPGEGKTFVTANLAQAIVRQPDRRALIIDADLRCARVHTLLGAPITPGLTDYLRGEADEMAVIQNGPEGNLCLIPGGSDVTNPSELLSNGRLNTLLERLAPVFDWIILDSPPCLPVADASILAGICDGVLLVVKAGSTPSAVAQRARQELQTRNVVGVVLNAVGEAHLYNSEYYHAYRYGYGNANSSDEK
jgi:capsular exopolysaccharide synthesis family protein